MSFRINEITCFNVIDNVIVVGIKHCTDEAGIITLGEIRGKFHTRIKNSSGVLEVLYM